MILTGLPGARTTTLQRCLYHLRGDEDRLVVRDALTVIDSYQSRLRWAVKLAWALNRSEEPPVVWATAHLLHLRRRAPAVIAHNRSCATPILHLLAWPAVRRGTRLHLLLARHPRRLAAAGQRGPWAGGAQGRLRPASARVGGGFYGRVQEETPRLALTDTW